MWCCHVTYFAILVFYDVQGRRTWRPVGWGKKKKCSNVNVHAEIQHKLSTAISIIAADTCKCPTACDLQRSIGKKSIHMMKLGYPQQLL